LPTRVPLRADTTNDATQQDPTHWPEAYAPECVEDAFLELRHDEVLRISADVLFNMGPRTF
jgi:hypothetical protein